VDPSLEKLRGIFSEMRSVLVCYSGGVDSALVLKVATDVLGPERAIGLTAVSPSLAPYEKELAISVAKRISARHELVESHEIDDPEYQRNGPDRCFHCKSELYELSSRKQKEWNVEFVANGTNLDDLGDHRPGLEAAKRAGVRSVLVEAGFHKTDVRRVAELVGLSVWDKPASACLSSRIPYGTSVTRERLLQIAGLEAELRALGLRQLRVRWHAVSSSGDAAIARIEVEKSELAKAFELRETISAAGRRYGFNYVTLDLEGYRVGSHNEVLVGRALRVVG
jgi:pyridinium-3,5-biscarboxylic acid mononucleotide sulfurtransferase